MITDGTAANSTQAATRQADDARADWEERIYRRLADHEAAAPPTPLPAPAHLRAEPGTGHIRLTWDPVPGAAGYVIERSATDSGPPLILRHGGSDVAAVVGPPFADTGIDDNVDYRYRIGAVAGAEYPVQAWSEPAVSRTTGGGRAQTLVTVDASGDAGDLSRVWQLIGSERLSQLVPDLHQTPDPQISANQIAAEFASALRIAHADLGATMVRAHAIFHDDNAVVRRDPAGQLQFDFTVVDEIYDKLLGLGLRPVVELSFMPAALARDPDQTVFTYRGIISPPADWAEWRLLVTKLAAHLVQRYGIDEVAQWAFEVWNEPNLVVFWHGSHAEYLRLYAESAHAIKAVDPRLRIGGPSTAAGEWVESIAALAESADLPLDFVSTHTYGNLPLDTRPALQRHGVAGIPIWWTEWGVGATHFGSVHDGAMGAPFVLSGFHSAQGRLDAMAYWVISDHFEELGRPARLFHNGFGLLTVGNLRKPRYWAVHLAAHMGDHVLPAHLEGDGAATVVQGWATRHANGTVDVLIWNGTINAALLNGDSRLDRRVRLTITGLPAPVYDVRLARVDEHHSNIVAACPPEVAWPDEELWTRLRDRDHLDEELLRPVTPEDGIARFDLHLPMPGVARIRLAAGSTSGRQ